MRFYSGFAENASNKKYLLTKYSIVNLRPLLLIPLDRGAFMAVNFQPA
jgi:hypothetical protein